IDNTGKVVWYRYSPNGRLNSFQVHPDGRNTLMGHNDPDGYFHVWDDLGEEVDSLSCAGYSTRFHDLMIRPDGTAWIMCDETVTMDLTAYGGVADADVVTTVVQHLARDGSLLWEWHAFDHVEITDIPSSALTASRVNLTHGNAITFDHAGNLLLSLRSLDQIVSVDAESGDLHWRFGGVRNGFTFLNDSKGAFEGQHGVREVAPGIIQLLDNGVDPPSRFVRYHLNPATKTALTLHEFVDAPTTHTPVGGGTDAYPNGHGAVTFGQAGRVVEIDEVGNRAWELTGIDGAYVFRVQRISSLYAPERIVAGR
ncbi:MAG: arylsulfotransferase family protein, partial [Gemmatimonadales bacterium]